MSRPMSFREFADVVNYVKSYNSPFATCPTIVDGKQVRVPVVKYIDPCFDMRSMTVFSVGFRGFGDGINFHCQNECRDLPESLHDRCMKWLGGGAVRAKRLRCAECQNDVITPCREGCPVT